jgi:hypothetical protein
MMRRVLGAVGLLAAAVLVLPAPALAQREEASAFRPTSRNANGSGIAVSYQVEPAAQASGAARVTLRFADVSDPAGASFRLDPDAGLLVAGAVPVQALPAGQVTTVVVDVTQRGEATGYLNVFTTQHATTGVTSIPVQVGQAPATLPAGASLKRAPDGGKISPLPVK